MRAILFDIMLAAEFFFEKAAMLDSRGRTGGFLCVAEPNGKILLVCQIGEVVDPADAARYLVFCQEKATRLALNPESISSWQTRNEADNKYGGAVRGPDGRIFSFSGLSEHLDEVLAMKVAFLDKHPRRRADIASVSGNPFLPEFFMFLQS